MHDVDQFFGFDSGAEDEDEEISAAQVIARRRSTRAFTSPCKPGTLTPISLDEVAHEACRKPCSSSAAAPDFVNWESDDWTSTCQSSRIDSATPPSTKYAFSPTSVPLAKDAPGLPTRRSRWNMGNAREALLERFKSRQELLEKVQASQGELLFKDSAPPRRRPSSARAPSARRESSPSALTTASVHIQRLESLQRSSSLRQCGIRRPRDLHSLLEDGIRGCAQKLETRPRAGHQVTKSEPSCVICLEKLHTASQDTGALQALACGHSFHASCIQNWLRTSPTCPLCKLKVVDSEEIPEARTTSSRPNTGRRRGVLRHATSQTRRGA